MLFIYVDSILAAGLFGSVLAQYREAKGREKAAFVAVAKAPTGFNRRNFAVYFFLGLLVMFFAVCWFIRPVDDYTAVHNAMYLMGAIAFLLLIPTMCVLGWLNGAVVADDSSPAVIVSFATIAIIFGASYLLLAELVALTIFWLCILAATAFFGYYSRVHATYELMMFKRFVVKLDVHQIRCLQLQFIIKLPFSLISAGMTR
jgi:predicted ABC-type sugar transport system permease subunit